MLTIPGYRDPMTLKQCVAEARWRAFCARNLRSRGLGGMIADKHAEVAKELMYAAREYKRGVKLVEEIARKVGA